MPLGELEIDLSSLKFLLASCKRDRTGRFGSYFNPGLANVVCQEWPTIGTTTRNLNDLPREIRDRIYEFLLRAKDPPPKLPPGLGEWQVGSWYDVRFPAHPPKASAIGLLLSCRQFHAELKDVIQRIGLVYELTTLDWNGKGFCPTWTLTPYRSAHVDRINLTFVHHREENSLLDFVARTTPRSREIEEFERRIKDIEILAVAGTGHGRRQYQELRDQLDFVRHRHDHLQHHYDHSQYHYDHPRTTSSYLSFIIMEFLENGACLTSHSRQRSKAKSGLHYSIGTLHIEGQISAGRLKMTLNHGYDRQEGLAPPNRSRSSVAGSFVPDWLSSFLICEMSCFPPSFEGDARTLCERVNRVEISFSGASKREWDLRTLEK